MSVRIAAVGDVHLAPDIRGTLRPALAGLAERADVLLLAGDLTRHGTLEEAAVVAEEFGGLNVPVLAVLGNHDYHSDAQDQITVLLAKAGIDVLEGSAAVLRAGGSELAVAGVKGFGGGFAGKCGSAFGEREMKAFIEHTEIAAGRLSAALREVQGAEVLIALTHYAPVPETLYGEPPEIYPFLGAYQLGEAIDGVRGAQVRTSRSTGTPTSAPSGAARLAPCRCVTSRSRSFPPRTPSTTYSTTAISTSIPGGSLT